MIFNIKITPIRKYDEKDFELLIALINNDKETTEESTIAFDPSKSKIEGRLDGGEDFGENVHKLQLTVKCLDDNPRNIGVVEIQGADNQGEIFFFPVQRALAASKRYRFHIYDVKLPHLDEFLDQRSQCIAEERLKYELREAFPSGPLMVKELPQDELTDYLVLKKWVMSVITKLLLFVGVTDFISFKPKKVEDYRKLMKFFPNPSILNSDQSCCSDLWFGQQKVQGINPLLIELCNKIPDNLAIVTQEIEQFLEGKTLEDALEYDRIFIINLKIFHELSETEESQVCAPIALFYLNDASDLMPIAIQLQQEPRVDNPVFTPSDPEHTWKAVKMFYNVTEGIHHETISHLSNTHIILDVACVSMRRLMSQSHPIYRLMQPHFWRLLGNNYFGLISLFKDGGIYEKAIAGGNKTARNLLIRYYSKPVSFRQFNPVMDLQHRGVISNEVLPYYPYRDDGLLIFEAIVQYVRKIVNHYYDRVSKLKNDSELKDWRLQLGRPQEYGGCGFTDLPGDNEEGFRNTEELVQICASMIFTASAKHSAVNYPQYDNYGYIPNHPLKMFKAPPTSKNPMSEEDLVKMMPNNITSLMTMLYATLLSHLDGRQLGDFDTKYLYHPEDIKAADELREELQKCTEIIDKRNESRKVSYPWLTNRYIKNSPNV